MTYNITLTANHQSLTAKYLPLAAESVQYLTAKVVYETDDWTGREIKAMFEHGHTVYEVPVTGGEITAKQQLNLTAGDWRVWLVGNSARDGDVIPRITTNVAHISVAPTGSTEGNPFPAIPPTVEEQLRADMGNLADLTTEDKSSLVAAINEAAESGGAADAVTYTPQALTDEQQNQARANIGAEKAGTGYTKPASGIPKTDLAEDVQTSLAKADTAISYDSQTLTEAQQKQARANIGAGQPDWNQNDSTQPDYVKNRPFYTGDPVETVLVEESTVSFAENHGMYMAQFPSTFEATAGETYKVYWDGAAYECTCVNFNNTLVIGNLSIIGAGSDTGEPFIIIVKKNVETITIGTADTSASHTISISGYAESVVKIDQKYLPVASETEPGIISITPLSNAILQQVGNEYFSEINTQVSGYGNAAQIKEYANINNSHGIFSPGKLGGAVLSCYDTANKHITFVLSGGKNIECWKFSQGSTTMERLWGISEDGVVISSSTPDSTKKFRITVDDNGEPTITDESDSTNTWKPTNLPTVTTSDAGKFLRVSDTGEWVAEIGQDGSVTDTVVTASASAWSNNTITLSVTGVMADSKLEIGLSNTATDEQFTVAAAAQIRATSSGDGTVTLKAVAAPSVDLPILIRRLS